MELTNNFNMAAFAAQLFVPYSAKQAQLESLANNSLANGIDLYQNKDYEGAAKAFKRSFNLSPTSSYAVDAAKYLAQSYLQLNNPEKAIKSYKTAISYHRDRDDLNITLGNLYFSLDRYGEALTQYEEAVRTNPNVNNHFSLGQAYIKEEKFSKAETEFNTYIRMEPGSAYGFYGLGQAYSARGDYEEAIDQFEIAIDKQRDFYDSYSEMGYAYADLGRLDEAAEIVAFLEETDASLAEALDNYISAVQPPKLAFAWADNTFRYNMAPGMLVSSLDSYLEDAGASKIMTMEFQFTKPMERASVENILNWSISRATGSGPGEAYNFGMSIPSTEITLSSMPENVYYDSNKMTATLYFKVQQNETADGTIDTSHIVFKFDGEDTNGISMDPDCDEFSGFSDIA